MTRHIWGALLAAFLLPGCGGATADPTTTTAATGATAMVGDLAVATTTTVILDGVIRIAPWDEREITSLCITSREAYTDGGTPAAAEASPVADALREGFVDWGLPVVTDGCDATLDVTINGAVLSAFYTNAGTMYTGADVRGTLTLSAPDGATLSAPFGDRKDPSDGFFFTQGQDLPDQPGEAPVVETIEDEVCAILEGWIVGQFDLQPAVDCAFFNGPALVIP